jgi:hypothetical protein
MVQRFDVLKLGRNSVRVPRESCQNKSFASEMMK